MNKTDVINEIKKRLNVDDTIAAKINEVAESNFLVGKVNKEKMLKMLCEKINVSEEEADKIYNTIMDIIGSGLKDKILNPFKNLK